MIVIKFYELHMMVTLCTFERVIAERQKDILTPFRKSLHQSVFRFWDSFPKGFIFLSMPGIETVVTRHFKVLLGDMRNQELYKIYGRKSPFYKEIVFVTIIVKGDMAAIIGINPFQSNGGSPEIAADIFNHRIGITEIRFGINVKAIFIFTVDKSLGCFERGSNAGFEEIQEGSLKGFSKEGIVEMFDNPPETVIRETALRNEAVNMWVPLQWTPKRMEDTDKAGNKVFRFVEVMKHTKNNTADSLEKTVKKRTVIQKEVA